MGRPVFALNRDLKSNQCCIVNANFKVQSRISALFLARSSWACMSEEPMTLLPFVLVRQGSRTIYRIAREDSNEVLRDSKLKEGISNLR
jgi:hypothetical protein